MLGQGTLKVLARRLRLAALLAVSILPSPLVCAFYRIFLGARIASGVRLGFWTILNSPEIEIGTGTVLGNRVRIDARRICLRGYCRIGHSVSIRVNRLVLAWRAIIDNSVSVTGHPEDSQSVLAMGMHSWIFPMCVIDVARPVILGRNAGIGGASFVFTHGYWLSKIQGFPVAIGSVRLGHDVWIPWACRIMPGVTIGSRVVVGAGAVVNKSIPENALAAGVPARVIRERCFTDVPLDAKMELLSDLLKEHFDSASTGCSTTPIKGGMICRSNDGTRIVLVETMEDARSAMHGTPPPDLTLVLQSVSVAEQFYLEGPLCSLENGISSPVTLLSPAALAFLQSARRLGIRYYPADEYLDSMALMREFEEAPPGRRC